MLRFGGEDGVAAVDASVSQNVIGSDPIEGARLGLRNIDRIAGFLVPATTHKGEGYNVLAEKYDALIIQRHRELTYVAKLVGGVEETRYQAGRGGVPFTAVDPQRQRQAVRFLVEQGFPAPAGLMDAEILRRIAPTGGSGALIGSSTDLLRRLVDPDVFQRMAEASAGAKRSYVGVDLLEDLNNGLFTELDAKAPKIQLYRRDLQRNYLTVLLVATGTMNEPGGSDTAIDTESKNRDSGSLSKAMRRQAAKRDIYSPLADVAEQFRSGRGRPSEFRAALRAGIASLYKKIDAALVKVKDPETLMHLREVRSQLGQVP
jgi:hypothetical protein